ncbi:MAG: ABC transporter permease [Burkholderiaceae bacterium]
MLQIVALAAKNLARKPFRSWALALAVAVAAGAVFATAVVMWGVERSLQRGFDKFGADVLVVPSNALVGMKSALLTGEPSTFYMKSAVIDEVRTLAGVAKVTPQLFLTTAQGNHCIVGNAFLVGIDPKTDFTVLPWIGEHAERPMTAGDAIVGGNNGYKVGDTVYFYGQTFAVHAKLDRTGIGLYDNAIFIDIDRAYQLAEEAKRFNDVPPMGFGRGDVSAVLVKVGNATKASLVRFAIAKNPAVKVVTAGNIVTSVRQNLTALFAGTVALAIVLVVGNVLMISAIFSTIVNERRKELGLLRAIGARRTTIFGLVLAESSLLTAFGGALGIALGVALMRAFARSIGYHLETLSIPFLWPPLPEIALAAVVCVALAVAVGALGAAYPALLGSRMEPYDAIRAGE